VAGWLGPAAQRAAGFCIEQCAATAGAALNDMPDHSVEQRFLERRGSTMGHQPAIYIVIPVHNRLEATRECLDSIDRQTCRDFHVVLVDDGSTDGTADYIGENYPDIVILRGDGNLWWTGATNLGVGYALQCCRESDYILTLNNDTLLPPAYLETMLFLAREAPRTLIGSIARDYHRRDVSVDEGVAIRWFSAKRIKLKAPSQDNGSSLFYAVFALTGRGTLIPVSVFRELGLYDAQSFPHYAADYDFSLRARKAGYDLLLHPKCYLYSRTDLTGISNLRNKVSFAAWLRSFNSIKSPNNLKIRLRFGLRHPPPLCRPTYIVCDLLRITMGTFRNQIRNALTPRG
jgi:GT2 family glycosyltransferase